MTSPVTSRLAWAACGLGLFVLCWGLWSLQRVYRAERTEGLAALEAAKDDLRSLVRREVARSLSRDLRNASPLLEEAVADPLKPSSEWLWAERGRWILPRRFAFVRDRPPVAEVTFDSLNAGDVGAPEDDSPWGERCRLVTSLASAVRAGDDEGIASGLRDVLEHRLHFRIDAARDFASILWSLDVLVQDGAPHPSLMPQLLVGGVDDGLGGRLPGLAPGLLQGRERLVREDFEWLAHRLRLLAAAAEVSLGSFDVEAQATGEAPSIRLASLPVASVIADEGRAYLEPRPGGGWKGRRIDLSRVVADVDAGLRHDGTLGSSDQLEVVGPVMPTVVEELSVNVHRAQWADARSQLQARYAWKSGLSAFSGVAALLVIAFAWVDARRRSRAIERREEFVATVSHELKTPLASMRLLAETLERKTEGQPDVRDYPRRVVRAADRLAFLVDNILSFNRLGQGQVSVVREEVSLATAMESLRGGLEELLERDGRRLDLQVAPGLSVEADPGLLSLLLLNLSRNSCLYNARDPVVIRIEAAADGTSVLWKDNGWGFDAEDASRAFDRFHRSDRSRREGVPGTGLGLSIARMVASAHGGTLSLEETGEGGSTFRIRLPASS